ncbi:RNA polymerase sigma factor FliA [Variovorax sp. WS11]|uniref:RNA polymerase sigma factor FliA n=1 Tax=Variovorax sp. WS11 TaxID=1105204 RepID=UPI000D0D9F74|nr:RNA polymerase sigma factor FliA [Variovorax sp. WS11]NDZ15802.1 RNA polymerase sigma factor FliA [Variovorax sp. WS11]PSL79964.1 RNA polymerase sigma factor FliA [Variovorax sp. WS11]
MYTAQGTIEKSHLLKQHQPMVRRMALQMLAKLPASVELDDLIQAGMIGLLDASTRYQDNRGAQFETFASQRIRGAMLDELRANDWGSRGLRQSARKVEGAIQTLEHRLGRAPTEGEIAKELKMTLEAYQGLLQEIQGCQLLYVEDFSGDGEGDSPFLDRHAGEARGERGGDDDPLAQLLESGFRHQLVDAIGELPERDRLLLNLYYEEELNLREIGAILEVSQSRVCQLHSQAISRLRAKLKDLL